MGDLNATNKTKKLPFFIDRFLHSFRRRSYSHSVYTQNLSLESQSPTRCSITKKQKQKQQGTKKNRKQKQNKNKNKTGHDKKTSFIFSFSILLAALYLWRWLCMPASPDLQSLVRQSWWIHNHWLQANLARKPPALAHTGKETYLRVSFQFLNSP